VSVVLLICASLAMRLEEPPAEAEAATRSLEEGNLFVVIGSLALMSFAAFALRFPWQTSMTLSLLVIAAVALGRGLGGVLADRFGWARISVGGLCFSIPLLALGAELPGSALAGVFLLGLALPVASTAVFTQMPRHSAFAFGLVSLALIAGAIPVLVSTGPGRQRHRSPSDRPITCGDRALSGAALAILRRHAEAAPGSQLFVAHCSSSQSGDLIMNTSRKASIVLLSPGVSGAVRPSVLAADVAVDPIGVTGSPAELIVAVVVVSLVAGVAWFALRAIRRRH
jgi:hypothetical protein